MKKLTTLSLLAFSLFCFSCGGSSSGDTDSGGTASGIEEDFTIVPGKRVGLITPETATREKVLELYGENARVDSVYLGEGSYEEGVVLYPGDPQKKVELFWSFSPETGKALLFKILNTQNPSDGTVWKTDAGITLGTSMKDVEKLNGTPFIFYGFEWDYGGFVLDWDGGKFPPSLRLRFGPTEAIDDMDAILGEVQLRSNAEKVKASKPKVSAILVNLEIPGS